MKNGKRTDVLIEDFNIKDDVGLKHFAWFYVWMDKSAVEAVKSIPGIEHVYNTLGDHQYKLYIDPRYDREYIKAEIEAQAKIHSDE